jgi:MFS family permease
VIVDLVGFGIVMPVLPFLVKELGASATMLGVVTTGYAAAQFACAPLWGRLSDRIGRRPVLLMTIAGTALSLAALGLAESLAGILAARVAAGAFAANLGVASAYIADATPEQERTRWMGLLGASFGVGFVLGPLIGGLLVPFGYGVPMLFAAGLAAVNGGFAFAVLRESPARAAAGAARAGRFSALREPRVRLLCAANLLFSISVTQLETLFAFFMRDRFAWDAHHFAGLLVAMAVVMGGVQGGAMKALSARCSERALVGGGAALLALAFLAIPGMPTVALLVAPLVAAAVGRGVAQPALMSLASLAAPAGERGAVMGAFQAAGSLARVLGPLAGGVLYDRTLAGPFVLAGLLMLAVVALARRMPARVAAPDAVGEARPA